MPDERPQVSGDYTYDPKLKRWSRTKPLPPEIVLSKRELRWLEFLRWRLNRKRDASIK